MILRHDVDVRGTESVVDVAIAPESTAVSTPALASASIAKAKASSNEYSNARAIARTDLGCHQLSYAAGSTSLDPDGYRLIGQADGKRLGELVSVFPSLATHIDPESLIINAYPAALGLQGFAPLVDTYLHPPTFIRAMRLAARQMRTVVLAAQPLVGADLLIRFARTGFEMPDQLLWATGGYYLPASLQKTVSEMLKQLGCDLRVMHCYGVAEVGHTCFAAIDRFPCGLPRYRLVAGHVNASVDSQQRLVLASRDRTLVTEDHATESQQHWKIRSGPSRMSAGILQTLESWTPDQWMRRTGYLSADSDSSWLQLREWIQPEQGHGPVNRVHRQREIGFHRFWERFGGSLHAKPKWSFRSSESQDASNVHDRPVGIKNAGNATNQTEQDV